MIYTTTERNDALLLIAAGKPDFKNVALYERLQEFNWIKIKAINGIINAVELTYAGKDLCSRLLKNKQGLPS
jgi:hypothetical protein